MKNGKYTFDDSIRYYKDDRLHREDGPAIIWSCGDVEYWVDGFIHHEDGPALVYADGNERWWIQDDELTEHEFLEWKLKKFLK